MMLAALDMVPDKDRVFLKDALTDLLLEKGIRPPPQALTSDGLRYYNLAIDRKSRDEDLSLAIQKNLEIRLYRQLNPESALHEIRCPVFLIHGAYDDLIPATESEQLHQRIPNSHLLISPFLTHTQPSSAKLSWSQKAAAAFDAFCFCYRFSQAIH
jgi:pimeloyl-ACP methyl ester carboxylesterase